MEKAFGILGWILDQLNRVRKMRMKKNWKKMLYK